MKVHIKYVQDYLIKGFTLHCPTFYSVVFFKAQKTFLIDKEYLGCFQLNKYKLLKCKIKSNDIVWKKKIEGEWSEQITVCFCNLWIYEYCDRQDVPGSLLLELRWQIHFYSSIKKGTFMAAGEHLALLLEDATGPAELRWNFSTKLPWRNLNLLGRPEGG